jgi:hypothetical protein
MDKSQRTIIEQRADETAPDLNSGAVFFPGFNPIASTPKHGWLNQIMHKSKIFEAILVDDTIVLRGVPVSVDLDQEKIRAARKRFVLFSFPISWIACQDVPAIESFLSFLVARKYSIAGT